MPIGELLKKRLLDRLKNELLKERKKLNRAYAEARIRLKDGYKTLEPEDAPSVSDISLPNDIPASEKKFNDIKEAIARLKADTYCDICEECGNKILIGRLTQVPWTKHCTACEAVFEKKEKRLQTYRQIITNRLLLV